LYCSPAQDKEVWIKVKLAADEKDYRVIVEDNGIGISEEIKGRIFEMFYRGTELSKGSGLGLYIAKSALKKIQGDVIFNSQVKTETIFEISFPKTNNFSPKKQ
jgi:signal transduction histidine kinase